MTVAPLAAEDRAEWLTLWHAYLAFYEADLDATTTEATFARLLDDASAMHAAVARADDGRVLGLVHWLTHPATWAVTDYCCLEDLFVADDARGHGVGRALIAHVEEWAAVRDLAKVYWLTAESNTTARALYDRVAVRSGMIQYRLPPRR